MTAPTGSDPRPGRPVDPGAKQAVDRLVPEIEQELHDLARRMMARERVGHTLQPTALVNEMYIKLMRDRAAGGAARDDDAESRQHFLALAATAFRRVLVDHAREVRAIKRGGGVWERVTLDEGALGGSEGVDLLDLDEALDELAELNEDKARIVELSYFGGLSHGEIGRELDMTRQSVQRAWAAARVWLRMRLQGS